MIFKRYLFGLFGLLLAIQPAVSFQNSETISTTGPLPGVTLINDINAATLTLETLNSGSTAPTAAGLGFSGLAGVPWHDTTTNTIKIRDQADSAWITLFQLDETSKQATVNEPILASGTNQGVGLYNHYGTYYLTGSATYTLANTTTLTSGFSFDLVAQSGAATIAVASTDTVTANGTTTAVGTGITIPVGYMASFVTQGAGNWQVTLTSAQLGTGTIASSSTTDLGSIGAPQVTVTGTTAITSFGTSAQAGQTKLLTFAGALTLTYNATSLILPTGSSITTAAGDSAWAVALGSGNWRVTHYQTASGAPLSYATLPAFSGDATSSVGSTALTLATVNASPGSYGSASTIPTITVDGKGRITAVANTTAASSSSAGVVGLVRNGKMSVPAASATATYSADEVVVETALGGTQSRLANYQQTINLGTTGVGGMDTGAAPASGFVSLYAISNPNAPVPTGTPSALYHFNGSLADSSGNGLTLTANGTGLGYTSGYNNAQALGPITNSGFYASYSGTNAAYKFAGNFTLSVWLKIPSYGSGGMWAVTTAASGSSALGITIAIQSTTGYLVLNNPGATGGTSFAIVGSTPLPINTWFQVAITRSGSTIYGFYNGQLIGTATGISQSFSDGYLYAGNGVYGNAYNGSIAELQIYNSTALYTTNYTPSTAPSGTATGVASGILATNATTSSGSVYSGGNAPFGTASDLSPNNLALSLNNLIASSTSTQDTYAIGFNGTTSTLSVASPGTAAQFTGNFTVEGWINPSSFNGSHYTPIFTNMSTDGNTNGLLFNMATSTGYLNVWNGATNYTSTTAPTVGAWSHVALVRSGSTMTIYLNGVSVYTFTSSTSYNDTALLFGKEQGTSNYFIGSMAGIRISSTARYTANFTPPTAPFTSDASTTFLPRPSSQGYTASALLGIVPTNASSQFAVGYLYGYSWYYSGTGINVLNITASVPTAYTSVSLSSAVPVGAKAVFGNFGSNQAGTNGNMSIAADSSGTAERVCVIGGTGTNFESLWYTAAPFENLPMITAQTLYYKSGGASTGVRININGYTWRD